MKLKTILFPLLLCMGLMPVVCSCGDDETEEYNATSSTGINSGHAWVDLGLPSGTKWATCNVGANKPEEYGNYYAWGETTITKDIYGWSNYKYCIVGLLTKYCTDSEYGYNGFTDNLTELLPEDDAATANWGSHWQMPSKEQVKELINANYTTTTWTTQNGVNGRKIVSKSNGKSIFLPASGSKSDYDPDPYMDGLLGVYLSRFLDSENTQRTFCLRISSDQYEDRCDFYDPDRCGGYSVRPVLKQ